MYPRTGEHVRERWEDLKAAYFKAKTSQLLANNLNMTCIM